MKSTNDYSYFYIVLAIIVLVVILLGCNLPTGNDSSTPDEYGLVQDYQSPQTADAIPEYGLNEAQIAKITEKGYPDRFVILFFRESLADGSTVDMRQESWYYDESGAEIVFRNGEVFTESSGGKSVMAVEMGKTVYRPEQFLGGMTLDQMLAATGDSGYYQEPVNSTLIPNGTLVFVQGLATGFEGGSLVFVEALPLGAAGDPANHP